jgi:hypothetical protein
VSMCRPSTCQTNDHTEQPSFPELIVCAQSVSQESGSDTLLYLLFAKNDKKLFVLRQVWEPVR